MKYLKLNESESGSGMAEVSQLLWQSLVFIGLLVTGAFSVFKF